MGGEWMVDVVGGLAVVCREEGLDCRQAQHPLSTLLARPLPLLPSPFSVEQSNLSPQPPFPCVPTHIQSLPPHSCGLAPLLLWIQPPEGSPRTAPHLGSEVHLPLARGTQVFQGPGSLALAVRRKSGRNTQGSLGIVSEGLNLTRTRDAWCQPPAISNAQT